MLGEKQGLCGLLAYLTLPKHLHPHPSSVPRQSSSLLHQEYPGESPGKRFSDVSPLSFFPSSINQKLAPLRQCQAQPQAPHEQIALPGPTPPPASTSYPVPGGPLRSTAKPPEPFPAPPVHLLKAEFYIWKFINFFVCGCQDAIICAYPQLNKSGHKR